MFWDFADIRPEERRGAAVAFFTLFGTSAAYAVLETARDALFLTRLPASQLPWVYLAMAVIAVGLSQAPRASRFKGTYGLSMTLLLCAMGTLLFWTLGSGSNPWSVRALYVWTGLVSTLTAVQFWLVVDELYTITQAKRLYNVIGLGSLLGAVAGGVLARLVTGWFDAHQLVLASAILMALTGIGPALFLWRPAGAPPPRAPAEPISEGMRLMEGQPYLARLGGLILVSTVAVTLADYVFKSSVSRAIAPARLAAFFATFYTILNLLALLAQFFLVGWLMRVSGLHRSLWLLPALLFLGAGGVALGGGLAAAILLKGADGALRPSLQRMGTELLFLPIPDRLRSRAKPLIDVLGQRGGQAIASVLILGEIAQHRGETVFAVVSAALCVVWIAWVADLRPHYLEMFRVALREGSLKDTVGFPDLDLSSLEVLLGGLNSPDDREVLGALDLLAEKRSRLIPPLILYHPSRTVVFHALGIFAESGRSNFLPIADRLLSHPDAEIRAAALRTRTAVRPEESILRSAGEDPSAVVRATALAGLVGGGWSSEETGRMLGDIVETGSVDARIALARAIERRPAPALEEILMRLAGSPEPELLRHVAHSMARAPSARFLPTLLAMLAIRDVREAARDALLAHGEEALGALNQALGDYDLPHETRRHIPRTISRFPPLKALPILQSQLLAEPDGMVRFRILRGLGRIATDHPEVALDQELLGEATDQTIEAILQLNLWRASLTGGAAERAARATPGHELLVTLLHDKEVHATERLFRLLGLRFRGEDFYRIHRGLSNTNPKVRAGSRELIENRLPPPLRDLVLALVEEVPNRARLSSFRPDISRATEGYEELLVSLLGHRSETLRSVAAYHLAELGLDASKEGDVADPGQGGPFATRMRESTREILLKRGKESLSDAG
jgi:AAA family ATP:ADP antiporter